MYAWDVLGVFWGSMLIVVFTQRTTERRKTPYYSSKNSWCLYFINLITFMNYYFRFSMLTIYLIDF